MLVILLVALVILSGGTDQKIILFVIIHMPIGFRRVVAKD